jgi:hypothetical protein
MTFVERVLATADGRWSRVEERPVWSAASLVVVAWGLIALNRIGGLALSEPRAVARLTVVGVWGWLALAVAIWSIATVGLRGSHSGIRRDRAHASLPPVLAVVGWSHLPVVALAVVVFIAAGALRILGPGLFVAVAAFSALVPFALVTGVRHVFRTSTLAAIAVVAVPYLIWLVVVVRHSLGAIQHLL